MRRPRRYKRRVLRRYKFHRRSAPGVKARTKCRMTPSTGVPVDRGASATNFDFTAGDAFMNFNCAMGRVYHKLLIEPRSADFNPTADSSTTYANSSQVKRDGNAIFLHGFKINRTFHIQLEGRIPKTNIMLNYAVIQWNHNAYTNATTAPAYDPSQQGEPRNNPLARFFRDHTQGGNAYRDFTPYTATGVWNHEMNVLSMNPDEQYRIITHRRIILQPPTSVASGNVGISNGGNFESVKSRWKGCSYEYNMNHYFKVYKTMSYDDVDSVVMDQPFAEIWWYNATHSEGKPTNVTLTPGYYLQTFAKNSCYWSETD